MSVPLGPLEPELWVKWGRCRNWIRKNRRAEYVDYRAICLEEITHPIGEMRSPRKGEKGKGPGMSPQGSLD